MVKLYSLRRHGSIYVRVPPCRLIRCGSEFSTEKVDNNQKTATSNYNNECDFDSSEETRLKMKQMLEMLK